MWWRNDDQAHGSRQRPAGENQHQGQGLDPLSQRTLARGGLVLAVCLVVATLAEPPLAMATFSFMTFVAALLTMVIGLVSGERLESPYLTRWDEGAVFMLLSIGSGWLVDVEAVQQAVEAGG